MTPRATESEFTLDTAAALAADEPASVIRGRSPWYLAWRRLRRNYVAFAFLALFAIFLALLAWLLPKAWRFVAAILRRLRRTAHPGAT